MTLLAVIAGAVLFSAALTVVFRELALRRRLLDPLTPRSSHSRPTPRLGGLGIVLSATAGWVVWRITGGPVEGPVWSAFVAGALMAAGTGLIDDLFGLRPLGKLAGQIAAVVPVLAVLPVSLPLVSASAATALWALAVVGYINFFNFFDGSDGLAAGVAVINAIALSTLAWPFGWSVMLLLTGASAAGFLWFNRAPASVFMGDAGSLFFGYVFGMLSVILIASGISAVAIALALAPLGFDCTYTLVRRFAAGERIWEAHRSHLYQRLLIAGWTHSGVAALYWSWAALAGATALWFAESKGWETAGAVLTAGVAAVAVLLIVRAAERRAAPKVVIA